MTKTLSKDIDRAIAEIHLGWTCKEQAVKMADYILKKRPLVSIEIGVAAGRGLVCLGLAYKTLGYGKVTGIDPWSVTASLEGEPFDSEQRKWWAAQDHEAIYLDCQANIDKFGVRDYVNIVRKWSDDVTPLAEIGFLRIDGNHGPAAYRDVTRFTPNVVVGGILHLDDVNWRGGASECGALEFLEQTGWREIDRIETGIVFERVRT